MLLFEVIIPLLAGRPLEVTHKALEQIWLPDFVSLFRFRSSSSERVSSCDKSFSFNFFSYFVKELVYLGTLFTVKAQGLIITPLLTRVDAIRNIPTPTTLKGCKSFCGVVNYLAIFCPEIQKLLPPIYESTKKMVKFVWTKEHEKCFTEIKKRLCEYPVLHLPTTTGRFILYSDTSRQHAGSAMWQMQNGQPKLIGYSSKTLPKACLNYSVTELEMFGLSINLHQWNHLMQKFILIAQLTILQQSK